MNRKKVAWLLTVAMVATSVDSSVLMANASDFSAETSEIAPGFHIRAVRRNSRA